MTGNQRKAQTHHTHIKGHHANRQNIMVLNALGRSQHPMPIRVLHKIMNGQGYTIDLVSLRRAVTNLSKPTKNGIWLNQWGRPMVAEMEEKPCPITGRTVGWYQLIPNCLQFSLFSSPSPVNEQPTTINE